MRNIRELMKIPHLTVFESDPSCGFNGKLRLPDTGYATVVCTWSEGWEHVSVSPYNEKTPTWKDMCQLKDWFWQDEEEVVQFHPKKSEYVNIKSNCLHLWRPTTCKLITPNKELVL